MLKSSFLILNMWRSLQLRWIFTLVVSMWLMLWLLLPLLSCGFLPRLEPKLDGWKQDWCPVLCYWLRFLWFWRLWSSPLILTGKVFIFQLLIYVHFFNFFRFFNFFFFNLSIFSNFLLFWFCPFLSIFSDLSNFQIVSIFVQRGPQKVFTMVNPEIGDCTLASLLIGC